MSGTRRGLLRRFGAAGAEDRPAAPAPESPPPAYTAPPEPGAADDAELDALRGELVRELNRLARRVD